MYGAIEDYIGDLVDHVLSTHLLLLRCARSSFHLHFSTRAFAKKKHALHDGLALEQVLLSFTVERSQNYGAHTIQKLGWGFTTT